MERIDRIEVNGEEQQVTNKLEMEADESRIFAFGTRPIGFIKLFPNMYLNMTKKPCWFHLLMARLLLGWKWIDADENGCIKEIHENGS